MFNKILVPLDRSRVAECVLPHLIAFARMYDAEVTLLHVLTPPGALDRFSPVDPLEWRYRQTEAEAYLKTIADQLQRAGISPEVILLEGQPAQTIIEYALKHKFHLIMLSSHGDTGLSRWNVNSVVRKIIQGSHTSTFLVRAYKPVEAGLDDLHYERILVPLDGSLRSECALPTAETLTEQHHAILLLGHVVVTPEIPSKKPLNQADLDLIQKFVNRNRQAADEYFDHLLKRLTVDFIPRVLVGENTAVSLHQLVENEAVDLVVISAHGFSDQTRWPYGSLTSSFVEYGTTSLLIVQDLVSENSVLSQAELAIREVKGH